MDRTKAHQGNEFRTSIRPGAPWLDTQGKRIHAHGGSIIVVDGTYYWYGENKEKTAPGNGIWHWGVRCYSSTDLYNWQDLGLIIPPVPHDESHPLHPSSLVDRPHIIFNPRSRKYVCWLKIMDRRDGTQASTVLTADSVLGPYEIVRTGLRPLGMSAGDFDLVVDPVDGKGYYYFERVHSEMICADLSDDFTDVTGYYSTHFPLIQPPFVREAPAHFSRNGLHYLLTSGTTGYFPNPSEVAVSRSYHGPWTVLGDLHPADASRTSYRSQISSVFKHPVHDDLYIALADRWAVDAPEDLSHIAKIFENQFRPGRKSTGEWEDLGVPEPDTSRADYVWLPLRFDGERAFIEWVDEWRVEDYV
ncbi:family 43 glycosylhydrolase [Microbacterium sp. STN6]|uniref:family 43 glycosylhydrolase n=1 Tax=Microbacterium sp. STN6 TaxID=2995588 RepID=UPI002260B9A5|nr:family 43 glycosylhydrolase [Microbacterium sp. STN6]MCX7522520.1 family 43 glycosylhydrolase [Microbacterium sp. STN6]